MELTDKLTTEQDTKDAVGPVSYDTYRRGLSGRFARIYANAAEVSYWAVREQARISSGTYMVTEALARVNAMMPVFAHVSKIDPTLVAYTPDKSSGLADRQVAIAAGRFFSKVLPLFNDKAIADLASDHTAEQGQEVEFIVGEAIAEAYANMDHGISACMSNKSMKVQPTLAYDAPNIAMAVLRRGDRITARTMVYTPSETDKRIIRVYGGDGPKLQKILVGKGYKIGTWEGATLRLCPVSENTYAVPYLDSRNAYTSPETCSLAILDGRLEVLTADKRAKLVSAGYETAMGGSTGTAVIPKHSSEDFKKKDAVTGEMVDSLERHANIYTVILNGETGKTWLTNGQMAELGYVLAITRYGSSIRYYVPSASTFLINGRHIVESETNRIEAGYVKFKDTPESEAVWTRKAGLVNLGVLGAENWVREENVAMLITDSGSKLVIETEIDKKDLKLHKDLERPYLGYVRKGSKFFVTESGRKVHPDYNTNVRQMVDGNYEFSRNIKYVHRDFDGSKYARNLTHYRENLERVEAERLAVFRANPVETFFEWAGLIGYVSPVADARNSNTHFTRTGYAHHFTRNAVCAIEVCETAQPHTWLHDKAAWLRKLFLDWYAEANAACEPIRVVEASPAVKEEQSTTEVEELPAVAVVQPIPVVWTDAQPTDTVATYYVPAATGTTTSSFSATPTTAGVISIPLGERFATAA